MTVSAIKKQQARREDREGIGMMKEGRSVCVEAQTDTDAWSRISKKYRHAHRHTHRQTDM